MGKKIPGINIQWPWSELIASGLKTVETRTYPIPEKYRGVELALIETPGPRGKKEAGIEKARIIATVVFGKDFQYESESSWRRDRKRHQVDVNDPQYAFNPKKEKWGWEVNKVKKLKKHLNPPLKRGIVFALDCKID